MTPHLRWCAIFSSINIKLVTALVNDIQKLVDWLKINILSLNLKKTHFIIFKKSRQKIHLENELLIDDIKIEMKSHTKFLGVLVDEHLTFEGHCKFIKGKIARGIGILYKGKIYLNQKSLLNIMHSYTHILPIALLYGVIRFRIFSTCS